MKLAVLIQCHKCPEQINRLLGVMKREEVEFFIHVDRKSDIADEIVKRPDVHILPPERRVDVKWGGFSQVEATLNLLDEAVKAGGYDYYFLISGQDFSVRPVSELIEFLESGNGANYVDLFPSLNNGLGKQNNLDKRNQIVYCDRIMGRGKFARIMRRLWVAVTGGYGRTFGIFRRKNVLNLKFYFGSQWWCLSKDFVEYATEYLAKTPRYAEFFRKASCPDESFFQTLLMNSPYADTREEYLHFIKWEDGKSSPENLTLRDFDEAVAGGKFMARKIDGDFALIDKLTEHVSK